MRIITNTAALLRPEEGEKLGIRVLPVFVSLGGESLRDYIDIGTDEFVRRLRAGESAVSSQPAVGDVLELLEKSEEETIILTVADGLSGEYQTDMGVVNTLPHKDRIHVINSGSLAGCLQYLAKKAAALRAQGGRTAEILADLQACVRSSRSYVIPSDLHYLKRSGRITNLTARVGSALNLLPVLTQTEDRRRISLMSIRRTWKSAAAAIMKSLREAGVDETYLISVCYADKKELAEKIRAWITEAFPRTDSELLQLSPSLVTHGGPGCVVVQAIRK